MLNQKTIQELREILESRRQEIVAYRAAVRSRWQTLSEPESELEESASKEDLSRGLVQLDDRSLREVQQIDAALARMEKGEYGLCAVCQEPIAIKRLRALPWALECWECAEQREVFGSRAPLTVPEQIEEGEMQDDEICDAIREVLAGEIAVGDDALEIDCEDGTVYLAGHVPNEALHQKLMTAIVEELGLSEVVDRTEIDELDWEEQVDTDEESGLSSEEKETAMNGEPDETDRDEALG